MIIVKRLSTAGMRNLQFKAWPYHPLQEIWVEYGLHCWAPKASKASPVRGGAVLGDAPPQPLPQPRAEGFMTKVAASQVLQMCLATAYAICCAFRASLKCMAHYAG